MRTGEIRSLLAVLRAGGVSEFSDAKRGVMVKLGAAPIPVEKAKGKKSGDEHTTAQAALEADLLGSKKAQQELHRLGVAASEAAEVLHDVS